MSEIAEKLSGEVHQLSTDFVRIYDRNKQLETIVKKREIEMSQDRLAKIHAVM